MRLLLLVCLSEDPVSGQEIISLADVNLTLAKFISIELCKLVILTQFSQEFGLFVSKVRILNIYALIMIVIIIIIGCSVLYIVNLFYL